MEKIYCMNILRILEIVVLVVRRNIFSKYSWFWNFIFTCHITICNG